MFSPPHKGEQKMAKEILIGDSDKADQEEFQKIFETTDYHLIFSESGDDAPPPGETFQTRFDHYECKPQG